MQFKWFYNDCDCFNCYKSIALVSSMKPQHLHAKAATLFMMFGVILKFISFIQVPLHSKAVAMVGGRQGESLKISDLKEAASIFVSEVCSSGSFKTPALTKISPCGLLRPTFRIMCLTTAAGEVAAEKRLPVARRAAASSAIAWGTLEPGSGLGR